MANEQVLAVLRQGMNTEFWGRRFYEQAVKRTASDDGKRVFESLVAEEGKHLDILREYYAKQSGQIISTAEAERMAASAKPTDIFPEAISAEQLIPANATDEQALEMAMNFERRGFQVYDQQTKQTLDPEVKKMWSYLAKAEDAHYAFLHETHEYLTTNGTWYFDAQEFPNFET